MGGHQTRVMCNGASNSIGSHWYPDTDSSQLLPRRTYEGSGYSLHRRFQIQISLANVREQPTEVRRISQSQPISAARARNVPGNSHNGNDWTPGSESDYNIRRTSRRRPAS